MNGQSIQAALDAASDGALIVVQPGALADRRRPAAKSTPERKARRPPAGRARRIAQRGIPPPPLNQRFSLAILIEYSMNGA